jgi:hypothetical protein
MPSLSRSFQEKFFHKKLKNKLYSARLNLVVEEVVIDGNHLLEFRGIEALPVKPSQQPEPSLACACGNA